MPLRNPVILAKELATLQFLSDNRVILGAGVGWNDAEYEAVGVHKSERGKRTDEMLDIMLPLLEGETRHLPRQATTRSTTCSSSRGRRSGRGSGSAAARSSPNPKSPDVPKFVESVKARTLEADGWIPRPTCPPPDIARDWDELQALLPRGTARIPPSCLVAHENFLHLVLTNDPAKAREEQHRAFLKVMSGERGPEYLESVYLFGTPDEIVASLQARVDAGVEYFFLHTMTPDPAQLQLWVDEIIPNVTFPATAGPVRKPNRARVAVGRVTRRSPCSASRSGGGTRRSCTTRRSRAAGIDARYVLRELEPDEVAGAVAAARGDGWLGLGVTAPYKQVVAGLVDEVERDAERIGAVNNVVRTDDGRLIGFNSDAPGFRAGVELAMGRPLDGRRRRRRGRGRRRARGRVRLPRRRARGG